MIIISGSICDLDVIFFVKARSQCYWIDLLTSSALSEQCLVTSYLHVLTSHGLFGRIAWPFPLTILCWTVALRTGGLIESGAFTNLEFSKNWRID